MRSSEKADEGAAVAADWVVIAEREGVADRLGKARTQCEHGQHGCHGEKQISSTSNDRNKTLE